MSLALCLSGGGLRAALYHLGVLKRLHELDLLHEVQALSAVSGGALTAALFQQSVEGYAAGEDGTPAARIRYEWNHVERCLLKAADAGLLDLYFRSLGLNIMLWLGFGISLLRILLWLWGPAGSHDSILLPALGLVVLGAAGLFLSLLPSALRTLRAQLDEVAQMTKLGGPLETFGKGKSASFREAARLAASPSAMRTATLALRLFDNQLLGQLLTRPQMYLGTIELNRGLEMVFSQWVLAGLNSQGAVALWEQRPGFSDGAADYVYRTYDVYSGYFWTDQALAGRGRRTAACKGFAEISREVTGTDEVAALAPQELCRHLRFSHLRWSLLRRAGRVLARWRAHSE